MAELALEVQNLFKEYRLGIVNHGTLKADIQSFWARLCRREDPHSLLGGKVPSCSNMFLALNDVSFKVSPGEVVGILGGNGAGKSTLLKILSRITLPSKGSVRIKGRVASLLEVGTGFHPDLTGRENIFLNGSILGMDKQHIFRRLEEIIDFSGIEAFIDTPVKRYSSGMYVRLAFAVAAHLEPEILLVDEVLAVGDAEFQKKCLGQMDRVSKEGRTVLFVSHNMNAINRLCNRAILLDHGAVSYAGDTSIAVQKYLTVDGSVTESEAEFVLDPEKPYQVMYIGLLDQENRPLNGPVEVSSPFKVKIVFRLQKPLPGGYGCLVVRDQRGNIVMLMDNRDHMQSVSLEGKGQTEVFINIPAPLFSPGEYTFSVSIARPPLGGVDSQRERVGVQIIDSQGLRKNRAGAIYQPLPWKAECD